MRKICVFLMLFGILLSFDVQSHADSNYKAFEDLNVESGKLLSDYTTSEYNQYYKKVNRRKFFGWRVYAVNEDLECNYVTETIFSYYNDGYTPFKYHYKVAEESTSKVSLSATGSIGIKSTSTSTKFKNNLDGSLKLSTDYTSSSKKTESYELEIQVDPGTQVDLYIYGEGKITNGVASYYAFWFRTQKGGYEVFLVTTQYTRLEKKRI